MASKKRDILLLENIHVESEPALQQAGIGIRREGGTLEDQSLVEAIGQSSMIGIRSRTRMTESVINAASNLEAIACFCIGTNQVDLDAAARKGIAVFNSPFCNTRSVAEMTIAEIIGLHRGLFDKNSAMHQGRWDKSAVDSHEVRGRTLGIVGYGHIGSQVSVLAEALGMRVIYHDIIPKMAMGNARAVDSLKKLLAESDVVTLHVPETAETRNLIDKAAIKRMKSGAMLINNSRGSIVDLDALAQGLEDGHVGGAAVDVYPSEPRSGKDQFQCVLSGRPSVILTPHIGGSTEEAQISIAREVSMKLAGFHERGTTTSSVNVPEVELPHRREGQDRILHFHHNVPGVLSTMHGILAEGQVNIHAEYLQSTGELSYVILDVDHLQDDTVLQRFAAMDETIRLRLLS
ncbi:MAG: phosphoglycerate dehydrogenase [Phycisphaerales bacterium]|nr:phosphoglycerate dehydrogenase [Phycisphaerales bacterium]